MAACREGAIAEDFNIGYGELLSINDLAHMIKGSLLNVDIIHVPEGNESDKSFVFDISKASNILGYKPHYTIGNGLLEQLEFEKRYQQRMEL